jgi:hypothetical protein
VGSQKFIRVRRSTEKSEGAPLRPPPLAGPVHGPAVIDGAPDRAPVIGAAAQGAPRRGRGVRDDR